jgi:TRAP-type C4-dicarboxylate transport system substrate-binding protein
MVRCCHFKNIWPREEELIMKKIILVLGTTFILVLASYLWVFAQPASTPIRLKGVQFIAVGNPTVAGYKMWADAVNAGAKGELTIDIAGGPEAVPPLQQAEAVRSGSVDICYIPSAYSEAIVPEGGCLALAQVTAQEGRETGLQDYLVKLYAKEGLYFLGIQSANKPFLLFSNIEAKSPKALAGKRIRTAPLYAPVLKTLNAVGVDMPHADLYTAMKQGLLDGAINVWSTFTATSWFEVAKYAVGPPFWGKGAGSHMVIINLKKWERIPKHLQDLMNEQQIKLEPKLIDYFGTLERNAKQTALSKGVKEIKWTDADTEWFLKTVDDNSWADYGKKIGAERTAKLRALMKK